ncbi:hypothetical protein KUTeg_003215 [Tegillarca granosa]|uniref:Saposin B-type domain-containing protein n=1 Tax=Tegillarca granosa TaxID=220873 RepID=A0ABQ9FLI3_TEGGR|nr:hypothetical protein KUTeg_003215 [Tegillarca granosa]
MLSSTFFSVYLLYLSSIHGFPDTFVNQGNIISEKADISVSNIQDQLEKVLPQDKEGVDARCELCKFILNYLDTYLKNNMTEALIDATLHKLCNATTGSLKIACFGAIPFIEKSVAQGLPPQNTCIEAGLCIKESQNLLQNSENTVPSSPKPALFHVPLQVQTGQASVLKDQINNVLSQNLRQPGDPSFQKTSTNNQINLQSIQNQQNVQQLPIPQGAPLQNGQNGQLPIMPQQPNVQQGSLENNQIPQNMQQNVQQNGLQTNQIQQEQQQNAINNEIKMGRGHLNLLPNSLFQKTSYLPSVQSNKIQDKQIQQNAQEQPNQQTAFTRRNQLFGLMPGPVLLQPNQIGTENKMDKSEDGLQIEKVTTQSKQNIPYGQKPLTSLSYIFGNKLTAFSQLLHKSTTTVSSSSKVLLDAEDGFLDVNKAETEDDDWYHIDDDEYSDDKEDENNDNNDDSMFKDKIDIDQETPNQDQANLETEWDTDKEKWDFKDFKQSINIPRTKTDTDMRLNIIAFYSWILFMSFLMVACIILVRHKYKYHPNGHKQYTWKTAAEEGKSLMKNVYS